MIQVTRCLHAAIVVADISRAEAFYDRILQLPKVERPFNYAGIWYQLGETQFHLIENRNFTATLTNAQKLGGNPHVAFGVQDLEQLKLQLEEHHYPYQMSASGRQALFLQDPDGNVIEISEDQSG